MFLNIKLFRHSIFSYTQSISEIIFYFDLDIMSDLVYFIAENPGLHRNINNVSIYLISYKLPSLRYDITLKGQSTP